MELFCFRTSVCLLVFQVSFPRQEPLWISSAQYYLKKVSREPVTPGPDGPPATLLALAGRIVAGERRLLEEALPCFQALAAGEDEATEALADQLFRLGDLCRNGGDLAGAARQLALCVRLREQLATAPCPAALDALACARGALGLLPGADPVHLEQAARLWQALALQQPAEERYARLRDASLRALERRKNGG